MPYRAPMVAEALPHPETLEQRLEAVARAQGFAAFGIARDTVAVTLGVVAGVNEEAFFDCGKIVACFQYFFQEQYGTLFQLARLLPDIAVMVDINQFEQSVHTCQCLFGGINGVD